jgi:signal transduction histidine kinase
VKLLQLTSRIFFLFSAVSYLTIGILFYYIIKRIVYTEVEIRLQVEKKQFQEFITENHEWSESSYFIENKVLVEPAAHLQPGYEAFEDTMIYSSYDNKNIPYRQILFYTEIQNKPYQVRIHKSLIGSLEIIQAITIIMAVIFTILLVSIYFFYRKLSKRIWRPFNRTLASLAQLDLSGNKKIIFERSSIYEFDMLNRTLEQMYGKLHQDYSSLEEFTENASHEMQSPMAVMQARIEQLIQSSTLSDKQFEIIRDIHDSASRMIKIHRGLTLLARIDNGQYTETSKEINLTRLLLQRIRTYEELLDDKKLEVTFEVEDFFVWSLSPELAEIMLTNMVGNAIRHNIPEGKIIIKSDENRIVIANTGIPLEGLSEAMFERFKKGNRDSESLGLGLAIVKRIAEACGLLINYQQENGWHIFTITPRR